MGEVLLIGGSGQLGNSIQQGRLARSELLTVAPRSLRLEDSAQLTAYIEAARPRWIVNAAAMTDVDAAERDPTRAFAVNAFAPLAIAAASRRIGARLIHISTEAVFSGNQLMPYSEEDKCSPVSIYGASKLAGENLVNIAYRDTYVLRTSWLYSREHDSNFPTRLLSRLQKSDGQVPVVTDIIGNPTPTWLLAEAIESVIFEELQPGCYHVCCQGTASKYDWAVLVAEKTGFGAQRLVPTTSNDFQSAAKRPKHVDLNSRKFSDSSSLDLPSWLDAWLDPRSH